MSVFERINAIRKMLNVPEETEPLQLSSGEIIYPWDLIDERGSQISIEEIPEDGLEHCYNRFLEWNCPEEYKTEGHAI